MIDPALRSSQPGPTDGPPPLTRASRVLAVVPHFRCEDWLADCLDSLTAQTRPPDGIVVIDDASAAAPEAIVRRFPSVTLLRAAANVGPYRLVQQVISDTAYDGYLFQDADDWSAPDRLARLLLAAELTGASLIGSDYLHVRGDTGAFDLAPFPVDVNAALAEAPTRHALQHPTSLVARTLVTTLGGYASGMRFSGDDEFLRRAAHVARVRNVPRVLYFRRHRAESLTTATDTGHGSPARRAVLAEMAERARANAAAVEAGEEPNLAPLRRGAPIDLEHLAGPRLDAGPSPARNGSSSSASNGACAAPRARVRAATSPAGAAAPIFVVGADHRACGLVLWSLGQHEAIEPVADAEALMTFGHSARQATAGDTHLGHRGITDEELRAIAVAATDRLALGAETRGGRQRRSLPTNPSVADAVKFAAAGATPGARRWAGILPARPEVIATALWLYPQARLIHVVGEPAEPAALRAVLLAEQAVGLPQAQRVDARRLRADPAAVLTACLAGVGEPFQERCTRPVRALGRPAEETSADAGPPGEVSPEDLLALALRGPGSADPRALSALLTATATATATDAPAPPAHATAERPAKAAGQRAATPSGKRPAKASGKRGDTPSGKRRATPSGERSATPSGERPGKPAGRRSGTAAPPRPATPEARPTPEPAPVAASAPNGSASAPVAPNGSASAPVAPNGSAPARAVSPEAAPTVALIRSVARAGQTVAVISRGDPDLLELGDVQGWHFPRTPDGTYAGYHPRHSEDAIAHLEELREQGADLLAVPATGMWWMEHYTAFREHLEDTCELAASGRDAGMVFDLRAAPAGPAGQASPARAAQSAAQASPAGRKVGRIVATDLAHGAGRVRAAQSARQASPARAASPDRAASPALASDRPTAPTTSAPTGDRPATPGRRLKVQVLAWNVTHNPLGRAHLLAELLAPHHDVELVGAAFPQFGKGVWPPHADSPLTLRTYPGGPFPEHHPRMEQIAAELDGDVLLVSKPRWPSFGVGLLAKQARNRALVLDIDDRELAFVQATRGLDPEGLRKYRDHEALANPHGRLWTQAGEGLVGEADAITVSSDALGAVYGGTVIPHARDEVLFDPTRHDRDLVRKRLGFEADDRVVLFPGTPRRHKGLVELAHALAELGDPRTKLCFIQTEEYRQVKPDLAGFERWLHPVPYQPFAELPALLAAADVVCVLQDPTSEVARYQMPAKVTDAFAMQVPCLVRPVAPLRSHIEAGRLEVLDGTDLAGRLRELFDDLDASRARARENRTWFLESASYAAAGPLLAGIVERAARAPRPLSPAACDVLAFQREVYGPRPAASAPATPASLQPAAGQPAPASASRAPAATRPAPRRTGARHKPGGQVDVVMFWKQNDTGIYGRRHDMLLAQLVRSRRVRRIVQFDHPIGVDELTAMERGGQHSQDALVLAQTMRRLQAPSRLAKLRQHTFVHAVDGGPATWRGQNLPHREDYYDYVRRTVQRHGIGRRPTVLWVYPKNFDFPAIADALPHDLVLADVVDDHRAWAAPGSARRALITRNYEEILARSDVVLANCEGMRANTAALAPQVALVPNGCDLRARLPGGRPPPELRRLQGPIVGYAGNLSSRIHVALLDELMGRRPEWSFVFIGSAHAGKDALRLDTHANAHFLGPRTYEDTRRLVRAFDVGIIPHLDNEMTQAMNPLKAFVYAALGVPTVATRIAGLDQLDAFIRVADTVDGFETAVADALAGGRRRPDAAGRKALREHAWDRRLDQILTLIDSGLAAHDPEVPA